VTSDEQEEEATSDDKKQACILSFVFNSSLVTCHSSLLFSRLTAPRARVYHAVTVKIGMIKLFPKTSFIAGN
jgi:hypothetical protein